MNTATIVDTIVEQSPTVKQARQQVTIAEAKLKSARHELIPDLQLKAGEQQNREALPEAPGRKTGAQSFASASIELPLWNRNQGNIAAAQAELDNARQDVTRTQLALRQKAGVMLQNYLSAKLEADQYRTALLPRARRAYQLYLDKYQDMAQAYPQVILSQRTLFQLEAQLHRLSGPRLAKRNRPQQLHPAGRPAGKPTRMTTIKPGEPPPRHPTPQANPAERSGLHTLPR